MLARLRNTHRLRRVSWLLLALLLSPFNAPVHSAEPPNLVAVEQTLDKLLATPRYQSLAGISKPVRTILLRHLAGELLTKAELQTVDKEMAASQSEIGLCVELLEQILLHDHARLPQRVAIESATGFLYQNSMYEGILRGQPGVVLIPAPNRVDLLHTTIVHRGQRKLLPFFTVEGGGGESFLSGLEAGKLPQTQQLNLLDWGPQLAGICVGQIRDVDGVLLVLMDGTFVRISTRFGAEILGQVKLQRLAVPAGKCVMCLGILSSDSKVARLAMETDVAGVRRVTAVDVPLADLKPVAQFQLKLAKVLPHLQLLAFTPGGEELWSYDVLTQELVYQTAAGAMERTAVLTAAEQREFALITQSQELMRASVGVLTMSAETDVGDLTTSAQMALAVRRQVRLVERGGQRYIVLPLPVSKQIKVVPVTAGRVGAPLYVATKAYVTVAAAAVVGERLLLFTQEVQTGWRADPAGADRMPQRTEDLRSHTYAVDGKTAQWVGEWQAAKRNELSASAGHFLLAATTQGEEAILFAVPSYVENEQENALQLFRLNRDGLKK